MATRLSAGLPTPLPQAPSGRAGAGKGALRQVADHIGGLSRDFAAGVMTAVLAGSLGR
jgi:hypothetical protein